MSERSLLMLPLANLMPPLPGLAGLAGSFKTYAPSPVWRESTTDDVKFHPMPKRIAVNLYHRARGRSFDGLLACSRDGPAKILPNHV